MVHAFEDHVRALLMEIGGNYYPLAEVLPANPVQFPLDVLEEQYDYACEHAALHEYGAHVAAALARAAHLATSDELGAGGKEAAAAGTSLEKAAGTGKCDDGGTAAGRTVASAPPAYIGRGGVLVPVPVPAPVPAAVPTATGACKKDETTAVANAHNAPVANGLTAATAPAKEFDLKEFELAPPVATTPFDALQMKSIDDLEVLRQLLTASASANVAGAKSDVETLSSSARWHGDEAAPACVNSWPQLKASVSSPDLCARSIVAAKGTTTTATVCNGVAERADWPDLWRRDGDGERDAAQCPSTSMMPLFAATPIVVEQQRQQQQCDSAEPSMRPSELRMTDKERRVVNAVADMGLDREAALRFVRRHGHNVEPRAVIDHLLAADSVVSRQPNLPVDIIEEAVHVCNCDTDKALQYARVAAQLSDLGFGPPQLLAAIHRSQGRRDTAIDLLLSGTIS